MCKRLRKRFKYRDAVLSRVQPGSAALHRLSVRLWASEPLRCHTCARGLWCHLVYWFTFPRFSVFRLHKSVFTLAERLICSRRPAWPDRAGSGRAGLPPFSRGNIFDFFCSSKRSHGCIRLPFWPKPIKYILFKRAIFHEMSDADEAVVSDQLNPPECEWINLFVFQIKRG